MVEAAEGEPDAEAEGTPVDPDEWKRRARTLPGTWWSDHLGWLAERSGELRDAPTSLGGAGLRVLGDAPAPTCRPLSATVRQL